MLRRFGLLLKNAWLIAWNLALLALVLGVPAVALWRLGWVAVPVLCGVAAVAWVVRRPAVLLGLWLGMRMGSRSD